MFSALMMLYMGTKFYDEFLIMVKKQKLRALVMSQDLLN